MKETRLLLVTVAILTALLGVPIGAGSDARTSAPVAESAIFYYPWYSTPVRDGRWAHWYVERDGAHVLSTPYFPSRGLYSSSNAKVVGAQMHEIAAAGITTVVVSWWETGSPEDQRLPLVAHAARKHGLEVAVHLEPYHARTPEKAAADILRLSLTGISAQTRCARHVDSEGRDELGAEPCAATRSAPRRREPQLASDTRQSGRPSPPGA